MSFILCHMCCILCTHDNKYIVPSFPCLSFFLGHIANFLAMRRKMKNKDEPMATIIPKWLEDLVVYSIIIHSTHTGLLNVEICLLYSSATVQW